MNGRRSGSVISDDDAMARARRAVERPLPPRFYKTAEAAETPDGFAVLLDDKPVRTPARNVLRCPARALAEALAGEWAGQGERIDPATMPLTRLVNTVLDGVALRRAGVIGEIAAYGRSDLLCYRAGEPEGLVALQCAHWDPVLEWAKARHGIALETVEGVGYRPQPEASLANLEKAIDPLDDFRLGATASMTGLTGSALLALAVALGHLGSEEAWRAAHVDEDWQISQWGEDDEAMARRAVRWADMQMAAFVCRALE